MYGPPPLELSIADAESTSKQLANEMLALSKLNWNNTRFDGGQPITVRAARRVCCTSITSRSGGGEIGSTTVDQNNEHGRHRAPWPRSLVHTLSTRAADARLRLLDGHADLVLRDRRRNPWPQALTSDHDKRADHD